MQKTEGAFSKMKKNIINLFVSLVFVLFFAGCAPQLARVKYGSTENQWKNYIEESYKDWEPSPTPPPINELSVKGNTDDNFSLEIVPKPTLDDNLMLSNTYKKDVVFSEIKGVGPGIKASTKAAENVLYTVKKGDTLWSISCKFFDNDGTKWKKIEAANKNVLSTPGSIKPGLILTIPSN